MILDSSFDLIKTKFLQTLIKRVRRSGLHFPVCKSLQQKPFMSAREDLHWPPFNRWKRGPSDHRRFQICPFAARLTSNRQPFDSPAKLHKADSKSVIGHLTSRTWISYLSKPYRLWHRALQEWQEKLRALRASKDKRTSPKAIKGAASETLARPPTTASDVIGSTLNPVLNAGEQQVLLSALLRCFIRRFA
jgi:hypothetical protein